MQFWQLAENTRADISSTKIKKQNIAGIRKRRAFLDVDID
jgi:hypothetical protein